MKKKKWTLDDLKNIEKLIIIDGKNRHPNDIAGEYHTHMREGYNLCIEEIAEYLRCDYQTAFRKFTNPLRRIGITEIARNILFTSEIDGGELTPLFTKRRLYNRHDFKEYLLEEAHRIITRAAYRFSDLSRDTHDRLRYWADKKDMSLEDLFIGLAVCTDPSQDREEPFRLEKMKDLPNTILSMKDLLNRFRYNTIAYRHIERYAIPKIQIGNLVRYNNEDFKEVDDSVIFTLPVSISKEEFIAKIERKLNEEELGFTMLYLKEEIRY